MSFEEFEKILLENNKLVGVSANKLDEPVKITATPTVTDTCKTENVAKALVSSSTQKEGETKIVLVWVVIGIIAAIMLFFVMKL
jgi:hypothetical protein